MARHKDVTWNLPDKLPGNDGAALGVLMDIRDELKQLNRVFACPNALAIPSLLRDIKANTTKPAKKRRAGK